MTKQEINVYEPIAGALPARTVALFAAGREAENAATPFGRSTLAAVVGGVMSVAMAERLIIASAGSPKSEATGKAIAKVSGLRALPGGDAFRKAWGAVTFILDNVDSDAPSTIGEGEEAVTVGTGDIRKAVVGFILSEDGSPSSLYGLRKVVADAVAAHAEAMAKAHGIEPETETKPEAEAPLSLTERVTATLVALQAADDAAFVDAADALALLSDYIDTRWRTIADATAPEQGKADLADAVETLAPVLEQEAA